MKKDIPYLNKV